jgi:hypothetical protein
MATEYDCFVSYASEDAEQARHLFMELKAINIHVWMDKPPKPYDLEGLSPGENWEMTLRSKIAESRFFLALLSKHSISKTGYVQSELRQALRRLAQTAHGQIYLIPIRLEPVDMPRHSIDGVSFEQYQWIDCFDGDYSSLKRFLRDKLIGKDLESPKERRTVTVRSAEDFYNGVASRVVLNIEKGFDFTDSKPGNSRGFFIVDRHDGSQIVLNGLVHTDIIGAVGNEDILITTKPQYANVLELKNCHHIAIRDLRLGHDVEKGYCRGGVIKMEGCTNIFIENVEMFGCGTYGFELYDCENVRFNGCTVTDCTYGMFDCHSCKGVVVKNTAFYQNNCLSGAAIKDSEIRFENCEFSENSNEERFSSNMFDVQRSTVQMLTTNISRNRFIGLGNIDHLLTHDLSVSGNSWQED